MWRVYVLGFLLLTIGGLSLTCWALYKDKQLAHQQLTQAVEVNKANTKAAKELREDWAAERAATEKELAATQERAAATESFKKDMENAPDAQKPAGPYWDELSKRLRSPNSGTAN